MTAARGLADRDPRAGSAVLLEAARAAWNAYDRDRYAESAGALRHVTLASGDPLGPVVDTAIAVADFIVDRVTAGLLGMRQGIAGWLAHPASSKVPSPTAGDKPSAPSKSPSRLYPQLAIPANPHMTSPGIPTRFRAGSDPPALRANHSEV
jgi:hypothetical protein